MTGRKCLYHLIGNRFLFVLTMQSRRRIRSRPRNWSINNKGSGEASPPIPRILTYLARGRTFRLLHVIHPFIRSFVLCWSRDRFNYAQVCKLKSGGQTNRPHDQDPLTYSWASHSWHGQNYHITTDDDGTTGPVQVRELQIVNDDVEAELRSFRFPGERTPLCLTHLPTHLPTYIPTTHCTVHGQNSRSFIWPHPPRWYFLLLPTG